jgi:transcriptional regulator with XRE-family HTH domain
MGKDSPRLFRSSGEVGAGAQPELGKILRRARLHRAYSLRDVERRVGVPNAHLSQIERGLIRKPDPAVVWRLADLFDLDYGLLVAWSGYGPPELPDDKGAYLSAVVRLLGEMDDQQLRDVLRYADSIAGKGRAQVAE